MIKDPFSLHTPSVFIVGSPFQCLCAEAAIKNLQISDVKLIAIFAGSKRDRQLNNYINSSNYLYEKYEFSRARLLLELIRVCFGKKGRYDRVFLGNFTTTFLLVIGMANAKFGAKFIYIDDGNSVISLLQDSFKAWDKKRNTLIYNSIAKMRGISVMKYFYTIYSDIKNPHYVIGGNDISKAISRPFNNNLRAKVYFVGTNKKSFCSQMGLTDEEYIQNVNRVFNLMKTQYPSERIVYIPHGSDPSEYAKEICIKCDADFTPVDLMVEDFMGKLDYMPMAIYGFCSTSLLNLKRLMPSVCIMNIFIHKNISSPYSDKYKTISDYYENNGIPTIEWIV